MMPTVMFRGQVVLGSVHNNIMKKIYIMEIHCNCTFELRTF